MRNQNKDLAALIVKTKQGSFCLEASDQGLFRLSFLDKNTLSKSSKPSPRQKKILAKSKKILEDYFSGKRVDFNSLPVDFEGVSPFFKRVYLELAKVSQGSLITYSKLAKMVGSPRAYRAVGSAMRRNRLPILLPCHRVVSVGGGLGGYSLGLSWKKRLLELEGSLLPLNWLKCPRPLRPLITSR